MHLAVSSRAYTEAAAGMRDEAVRYTYPAQGSTALRLMTRAVVVTMKRTTARSRCSRRLCMRGSSPKKFSDGYQRHLAFNAVPRCLAVASSLSHIR